MSFHLQARVGETPLDSAQQRTENSLRIVARLFDHPRDIPEFGNAGIAHALIHPTLARRDDGARGAQPVERDGDLLLVAAADAVGQDVDLVAAGQEVQRRLGHADVALYPDDDHLGGRRGLEVLADLGHPHAEEGLVHVDRGLFQQRLELRHGLAELRLALRRHVDGDLQHLGKAEHFLGGQDADMVSLGTILSVGGELTFFQSSKWHCGIYPVENNASAIV